MNKQVRCALFIALIQAHGHARAATQTLAPVAPDPSEDAEPKFNYGDSCGKLADLSWETTAALAAAAKTDTFAEFCAVSEPGACADYGTFLVDFGDLVPSPHAGYCRFFPYGEPVTTEVLRNYGSAAPLRPASPPLPSPATLR